ncbi:hypothetical protein H2199_002864 [Coniosporium tulheliwenetii]|uniref:Uncharacterized protein n=1 Tax=Coniosporium tulheliwenetii TaxID=3383036 RepID=A0ACC2ZDK1_9PEZI|nr:hypothetical protein H2199_002864 [Cladosporium sp. JES 115]
MRLSLATLYTGALSLPAAFSLTISEINGNKFLSPYIGQAVTQVTGLITAKGPDGLWLRSTIPDNDRTTSDSIYVFGRTILANRTVGDIITLDGKVTEFRSSSTYLYLTQISSPSNVATVSSGNEVTPLVLGKDNLNPPTEQYTSLDNGDVFGVPNNVSLISRVNPILEPEKYGLDFWESLMGELVTIQKPRAVAKPNNFRDTWVVGKWKTSGDNKRGGLTMTDRDANPEAILIGTPLDGTRNPTETKLGDDLADITGIVYQAFGFYRILPLTALQITGSARPELPSASKLTYKGDCKSITFGVYNVENLAPNSAHLPAIAAHIVNYLNSPSVVFLQEIQDNNGPTNDAVVDANLTLSILVTEISKLSSVPYSFVDIDPVDDRDGGQPGGNIRVAYLYDTSVVRLRNPNPGSSTDANEALPGPELKYNPGRIDPQNTAAWTASRKPLAAAFETLDGQNVFFTVNVHFGSKGGSSSLHGDARPPVNGGVDDRQRQAEVTASFIASILSQDANAKVIAAGDFNEFAFVAPLEPFLAKSGLRDLDEVAGIKETERYTYLFDMNSQQLDHMYISSALTKGAEFEHVHVNMWGTTDAPSDHDPSVARLNVCGK